MTRTAPDAAGSQGLAITIHGQVQGVGFRPFIWKLARSENLAGFVRNTSAGVLIEVEGSPESLAVFERRLHNELPPLARITAFQKTAIPWQGRAGFRIEKSVGHSAGNVLVSPDVGACPDCIAEMRDPANRRHGYPFINCVNCGPRYTITRSIPYDRPVTTMSCFELCPACAAEYANPADRRFHAQPIACAECGPSIWYADNPENSLRGAKTLEKALERAGGLLLSGGILALKGLGGFQLACDARNNEAVARLRRRKSRPHKALAVMARDIEAASLFCHIQPERAAILDGPEKPITICPRRENAPGPLAPEIAPDVDSIGIMLPCAPLHLLLLDWLHGHGMPNPALVMSSANAKDEPICLGNREALAKLRNIADGWLLHNRDILVRIDDSVVDAMPKAGGKGPFFLRRARGYTPGPVALPFETECVFGAGAELKAAFCLTRGNQAFLSQHIGDLKSLPASVFYKETLGHLLKLLEVEPKAIVRDLHPDYISSQFAEEYAREHNVPLFRLQHHAAHAFAVLAEHGCMEPALALCLDGAGLGDGGAIWGGEFLLADLSRPQWRRIGGLSTFRLPGGDAAALEPWRIARALQWQTGKYIWQPPEAHNHKIIDEMLERDINCARTSSCGRLFDGAAALCGLCDSITYEGQAAIRLETAARQWLKANPGKNPPLLDEIPINHNCGLLELDCGALFASLQKALAAGRDVPGAAASFHFTLARCFTRMAETLAKKHGLSKIALGGGVLQNALLASRLLALLPETGLTPLFPAHMPPGDGGIALGQAAWGARLSQMAPASLP